MSHGQASGERKTAILRLRPTVPTELIRPRQRIKQPDGPWIAHPELIDESIRDWPHGSRIFAPDITMEEYRNLWKADEAVEIERLKSSDTKEDFKIVSVLDLWPSIKMQRIQGKTDHEVASAIERHYVGAHQYGAPFHAWYKSNCHLTFIAYIIAI